MKTDEAMTDGTIETVYTNYAGQAMMTDVQPGNNTSQHFDNYYRYDNNGRVIWQAQPSAVSGYDDTKLDLVNVNATTGKAQYLNDNSGVIVGQDYFGWNFQGQ